VQYNAMRIISENSLKCFLADLRQVLGMFIGEFPEDIHFISIDSFYFYMNMAFPKKCREIGALMHVLEPYIPLVVSGRNMESILTAYEAGDFDRLLFMEESLMGRSKLIFLNSAMTLDSAHWEDMVRICCQIRAQRVFGIV